MKIFLSFCTALLLSQLNHVKAQILNSTASPSSEPTIRSTVPPTSLPTFSPTKSPSSFPSIHETFTPSYSPSHKPTILPTIEPTLFFSELPSQHPSQYPFEYPSQAPSISPSISPTISPSISLSISPSISPSYFPNVSPSKIPSSVPTFLPTSFPKSSIPLQKSTLRDLQMALGPMDAMGDEAISDWENVTSAFIENYYKDKIEIAHDVVVETKFTLQSVADEDRLIITFDQTVSFRNLTIVTPETLISDPFNTLQQRNYYITSLKNRNSGTFGKLLISSIIQFPPEIDDPVQLIIIIAIVSAIGVATIFIGLFFYRRRKLDISPHTEAQGTEDLNPEKVEIDMEPTVMPEDEPSISTMDYDYSRAFTGDGSVSSAGGTWGENTRNTHGMTNQSQSLFSNDDSFQNHYTGTNANVKETIINIFAPPGKLGVVIDTPDDGAPVVHAIKDTSIIADKLKVGDHLVAVDDEDVRKMTAIKVSKLISRKSENATRKLSVVRSTVVE